MLKNTYILYHEVEVKGEPVDCIYLNGDECRAQPYSQRVKGAMEGMLFYKPNEEDKKRFCQLASQFKECPRFVAYQNHLRAIGLEKP